MLAAGAKARSTRPRPPVVRSPEAALFAGGVQAGIGELLPLRPRRASLCDRCCAGCVWRRNRAAAGAIPCRFCFAEGAATADAHQAVFWRRAAEQGHASAQFAVGVCHDLGRGVDRDTKRAALGTAAGRRERFWPRPSTPWGSAWSMARGVDADFARRPLVPAGRRGRRSPRSDQPGPVLCHGQGIDKDAVHAIFWARRRPTRAWPTPSRSSRAWPSPSSAKAACAARRLPDGQGSPA